MQQSISVVLAIFDSWFWLRWLFTSTKGYPLVRDLRQFPFQDIELFRPLRIYIIDTVRIIILMEGISVPPLPALCFASVFCTFAQFGNFVVLRGSLNLARSCTSIELNTGSAFSPHRWVCLLPSLQQHYLHYLISLLVPRRPVHYFPVLCYPDITMLVNSHGICTASTVKYRHPLKRTSL